MTVERARESTGRGRFLLALSLSTVTAAAVAAPLALSAVRVDSQQDLQIAPASPAEAEEPQSPTLEDPDIVDEQRNRRGNIGPAPVSEDLDSEVGDDREPEAELTTTTTAQEDDTTGDDEAESTTTTEPAPTTAVDSIEASTTTTTEVDSTQTLS